MKPRAQDSTSGPMGAVPRDAGLVAAGLSVLAYAMLSALFLVSPPRNGLVLLASGPPAWFVGYIPGVAPSHLWDPYWCPSYLVSSLVWLTCIALGVGAASASTRRAWWSLACLSWLGSGLLAMIIHF